MDKLTRRSGSMRFSVRVRMMVEVATDTGVTATAGAKTLVWLAVPPTLVWLERPSDYEVTHMRLELGQGVIMRMAQTAMPDIQRSCRSGL